MSDRMEQCSRNRWIAPLAVTAVLALGAAAPVAQNGPAPLTNADVIRMVAGKLTEPVTIAAIEHAVRWNFDLSADGLISLNRAGVPDAIIITMLKAGPGTVPSGGSGEGTSKPASATARPASPTARTASSGMRPQEPSVVAQVFRVNPTTGGLMPLEAANARMPAFDFRGVYLDGPSSSVTFPDGEPHAFTLRSFETVEKLQNVKDSLRYEIEYLAVRDDKRYATKVYVPLDIADLGPPRFGLAAGRPYIATQSILLTPRTPLAPGQYAFTRGGILNGGMYGTFAIANR